MTAIYLSLFAVVVYSIASIVRKQISAVDDNLNFIYAILFQFFGGFFVFIFSWLLGFGSEYGQIAPAFTPSVILKILIGSVLWISSTVLSFRALNKITASKFSIIETLAPVVSIALALTFLGESFGQLQFVGMALILISVFVVVYDKDVKFSHFSQGEILALLASVFGGIALANDKGIYFALPLTPALTIMFILPGILGLLYRPNEIKKLKLVRKNGGVIKQILIMSSLWSVSAIAYYKAVVVSNSLALVTSINQLSVVLTVLLGLIFLKETENWLIKIIASIVSVVGLVLMSI